MIAEVATALVLWVVPPSPSPIPTVHPRVDCPGRAGADCLIGDDLYWPSLDQVVLQHELGHAYDHRQLSDGERRRISRVLRWPAWDGERFAQWYAACRLVLDPRDYTIREDGFYEPFTSLQAASARCRLISRAGL